jgi:hypothetical protein
MPQTLAQRVRAKYPDTYADMNDQELEEAIVRRHPGIYDDIPRTQSLDPSTGVPPYAATARMIPQSTVAGDPLGTQRGSQADRRVVPAPRPEWFMDLPPQTTTADRPWPEGTPAQLVESARRSLTPVVKIGKGLWDLSGQFVYDPERFLGTIGDITGELARRPGRELQSGIEAARSGNPLIAVSQAAAAVPFVGGIGADIYREAKRTGDLATAAGEAGLLVTPTVVGRTLARMPKKPINLPSKVPLSLSERTGSPFARWMESLIERTLPGAGPFGKFRRAQEEAVQLQADQLVRNIAQSAGLPEEIGLQVLRAMDTAKRAMQTQGRTVYGWIDEMAADVQASMSPLKKVGREELVRLKAVAPVAGPGTTRVRKLLERIVAGPDRVSFKTMQDYRTEFRDLAETLQGGEQISGRGARIATVLRGRADDAMMAAAVRSRVPGLQKALREADTLWRTAKTTFNDTVIKKLMESAPEKIPAYVQASSLSDIRTLAATISPESMNNLRASLVRDLINRSTRGERAPLPGWQGLAEQFGLHPSSGRGVPGLPSELQGGVLRTKMQDIGAGKMKALFGDDVSRDLIGLARVADRAGSQANRMSHGLIAAGINALILSPVMSPLPVLTLPATVATGAGLYSGLNILARLLLRQPKFRGNYRAFLGAIERGDMQAATTLGLGLSRSIEAESPVPPRVGARARAGQQIQRRDERLARQR